MYINQVTLIGNLTRDPELKALPSGDKVASFGLATNRTWKNKEGQKQEEVEYHNCVVFGRSAETIAQYMKKGSQLLVEGRLKTSTWEDKNSGKKMYKTEIIVERSQFGNRSANEAQVNSSVATEKPKTLDEQFPTEDINPDDIPF